MVFIEKDDGTMDEPSFAVRLVHPPKISGTKDTVYLVVNGKRVLGIQENGYVYVTACGAGSGLTLEDGSHIHIGR